MQTGPCVSPVCYLEKLLLVKQAEMLHVNGLLHSLTLDLGRFLEVLACAEFADGTGLFEFSLEFLESPFDIFTFFNGYDNHFKSPPFSLGLQRYELFLYFKISLFQFRLVFPGSVVIDDSLPVQTE